MSQTSSDATALIVTPEGEFGTGFFTGGEVNDEDGQQTTYWAGNIPDRPIRLSQDLTQFDERLVAGLIVNVIRIERSGFVEIAIEDEDVCQNVSANVVRLQLVSYTLKKPTHVW